MAELEALLGIYINFFQPSVKLKHKIRVGTKVKRVYNPAKTPFERVLESNCHSS